MTEPVEVTVLLVDDSRDEREMWATFFRQHRFRPVEAATSEDALRLAMVSPPAVVVADLRLPGSMNGLELTRRLKQSPTTKFVPVVMLTGMARPHDRMLAQSVGVDAFLSKPCPPDDLLSVVHNLIAAAAPRRGLPNVSQID